MCVHAMYGWAYASHIQWKWRENFKLENKGREKIVLDKSLMKIFGCEASKHTESMERLMCSLESNADDVIQ
jgi:hypothetical protein